MAFSYKERQHTWQSLKDAPPEIVIIGAGVVGTATATAAARLGLHVLLIDKGDIAGGTSGASTGLAHAGLRYLAQGHIGYVFKAGRERRHLQEVAPHWVRPFDFILPVYKGEPHAFWVVRLGTFLYDWMARVDAWFSKRPMPRRYQTLSAAEVQNKIPGIKTESLEGGLAYFVDAQMQDTRLTLGLAQSAAQHGAKVLTYAEVKSFHPWKEGGASVIFEDRLTGEEQEVRARIVVNASGPWIDQVRALAGFKQETLKPSQGLHLVVDHITNTPLIFSTEIPNKVFFVLPVDQTVSLVGTTDTPIQSNPERTKAEPREVTELLQRLFTFFPYLKQGSNLQEAMKSYKEVHVRSVYWGVRPLLKQIGSTLQASREHAVLKEALWFWSVPGVKLTSGLSVGEEIGHGLWKALRKNAAPNKPADSLPGGELWDYDKYVHDAQKRFKLGENSDQIIRYLISLYGTRYVEVLQWANREPHYRERILEGEPWILAQVPYAIQEEMVLTLNDLLWRRTKWALWRSLPEETVVGIAQEMAEILGWSPETRQEQFEAYQKEKAKHQVP